MFPVAPGRFSSPLVENPIKILHRGELRDAGASVVSADIRSLAWGEDQELQGGRKAPPPGLNGLSGNELLASLGKALMAHPLIRLLNELIPHAGAAIIQRVGAGLLTRSFTRRGVGDGASRTPQHGHGV